jgi:uncharacterized protein involved in exopolysaccharide biosynthesis/Mrp family chromosome partitioning ATPase
MDQGASLVPAEEPSLEALHTEMATLNSPEVAAIAVASLGLTQLRDFQNCPAVPLTASLWSVWARVTGQAQKPPPPCTASAETAAAILLGKLSFGNDRASYIIQISAADSDPKLAAKLANAYAAAYVAFQREQRNKLTEEADEWLSQQLADMHTKMIAADRAIEAYRQQHHLIGMHGREQGGGLDTVSTQQLQQLTQELSNVTAELADKTTTLSEIRAALGNGQFDAIGPVRDAPAMQNLLGHHEELASALASLRANFGPSYPSVASAEAALAGNEAQIRAEAGKTIAGLNQQVAALNQRRAAIAGQVAGLEGQVAGESEDNVGLSELERESQTDRNLYESLFLRLTQVDAERRFQQTKAAIAVEAVPPDAPSYPKIPLMVVGAFLGALGIGTGLAFVLEMVSRRFRDSSQVESEMGLPVFGVFPKSVGSPQSIVVDAPFSIEAEALYASLTRLLGTSGLHARPLGKLALITSAIPGEGKSSFCVAIGRAARRLGLSAFVLDCDLRHPSIENLILGGGKDGQLVVDKATDLTEWRQKGADPGEIMAELFGHAGSDDRSGLRYLALGNYVSNPQSLFAWPEFSAALRYLRSRYDLVLLDTPPVLVASDTLRLGGLADDVLMLIDWRTTPRHAANAAVRSLQRSGIVVTGAIMSKVDLRRDARFGAGEESYLKEYQNYHRPLSHQPMQ